MKLLIICTAALLLLEAVVYFYRKPVKQRLEETSRRIVAQSTASSRSGNNVSSDESKPTRVKDVTTMSEAELEAMGSMFRVKSSDPKELLAQIAGVTASPDPAKFLDWLMQRPRWPEAHDTKWKKCFIAWLQVNPDAALAYLLKVEQKGAWPMFTGTKKMYMDAILAIAHIADDPASMANQIENCPKDMNTWVLEGALLFAPTAQKLTNILTGSLDTFYQKMRATSPSMEANRKTPRLRPGGPVDAWLRDVEASPDQKAVTSTLMDAIRKWQQLCPDDSVEGWLQSLPNTPEQKAFLLANWATLPENASELPQYGERLLDSLPAETQAGTAAEMTRISLTTNFNEAGSWLNAHKTAAWYDPAAVAFAEGILHTDPAAAADWSRSIKDESLRQETLGKVLENWSKSNPGEAQAYLERGNQP